MSKIIIFGGTFNPIHNAHLEIAKIASEKLGGAKVLFMPNGIAPHKETDLELMKHRAEMVKLAIEGYENFEFSGLEVESKEVSYTIYSLKKLNEMYSDYEIYFLTGEDFLYTVELWQNAKGIFDLATYIVFSRPKTSFAQSLNLSTNKPLEKIEELKERFGARILYLDSVNMDLSASNIRLKFQGSKKDRQEIKEMIPLSVYEYAKNNHVYETEDISYLIESIERDVVVQLSDYRASHTISVAETARKLALLHGEDPDKAYLAGLLHDIAKEYSDEETISYLEQRGIPTDKYSDINLNHAMVSKIVAEEIYGVTDPKVLTAIEHHTFGTVGMTKLEMIVSLADVIEPKRNFKGEFKELMDVVREKANVDIVDAYMYKLECLMKDFERRGKKIEPNTINIYNDLKRRKENDK